MNELLSRISSYNIFNYLFPGAVFVTLGTHFEALTVPHSNIVEQLVWYYLLGMTISRVGSTLLEPILRRFRFITYSSYTDYLKACEADTAMPTMVEVANTFRTLAATFGLLLITLLAAWAADEVNMAVVVRERVAVAALLALFLASFRKQVGFIAARVAHYKGTD